MILFPAIDLKDGVCVRLEQGDMGRATVFNRDPAAQAQSFVAEGFEYLHVVDLDAAFAGRPVNVMTVERIIESVPLPVQLGGGLRDMTAIAGWLEKGVDRAIIGTAAVRDPALVKEAARAFPGRIAVGLDARDGLLKGLNLDATIALADAISIPVIASGGLASIDDIRRMLEPRAAKLAGAIAGRALYDGRLNASEALRLIRAARS